MALLDGEFLEQRETLPGQRATSRFNHDRSERLGPRDLVVVYGPAGCGKSSIARVIADSFGFTYIEGDEHHSSGSIAKMSANVPLDDADRWDWLIRLREAAIEALEDVGNSGVVMTCSALKRKYRDVIRIATLDARSVRLHFLYLDADLYTLKMRVHGRKGHYMSSKMIESQLRDLEPIGRGENDVVSVDVNGSQEQNKQLIIAAVNSILR